MKEKSDKKVHSSKGSHGDSEKNGHHNEKHHSPDKHPEKSEKHHDKHDKHHDKHEKHHALKGAAMNAAHTNAHHGRHRSRSLSRKDTTHSVGHGSVKGHGHKDHDKASASSAEALQPEVKYENTYKMLPDFRFLESKVKDIMTGVFEENITEKEYDPQSMGQKCKLASEIIKEKVKSLDMQRFKIICHVLAAQKGDQSMIITSRCLWDQRFDNSATVTVKRGEYIVIGMVFAVYAE